MDFDYSRHIFRSPGFQGIVDTAIEFLEGTPVYQLPPPEKFVGSGVYCLYYIGDCDLYAPLSDLNHDALVQPIYVGKAVPPGWRTGRSTNSQTPDLYHRLREHTRSIQSAENLQIADFRCRFMLLGDIESDLVVPVEAALIRKYHPLWNAVVDGFGNHDPGAGRYNQARSEWDVLHPGRVWAERLTGRSPDLEEVTAEVQRALKN